MAPTYTFDWSNLSLGILITLFIECLFLHPRKLNSLNAALLIATICPLMSLLMRDGIINPDSNYALVVFDALIYVAMVGSVLYIYIFRLRVFDSKTIGAVRFVTMDWIIFASQTVFNIADMVIYHIAALGTAPSSLASTVLPIMYIIEVSHELYIDLLLLLALRRQIKAAMDKTLLEDLWHLVATVVFNVVADIGLVVLNYTLDSMYFFGTKRLVYAIKIRLAFSMFKGIKERRLKPKNSNGAGQGKENMKVVVESKNSGNSSDYYYGDSSNVGSPVSVVSNPFK